MTLIATNNKRINEFAERLVDIIGNTLLRYKITSFKNGEPALVDMGAVIRAIRRAAVEPEYQEPNIEPMLDLSTAHLSIDAMAWLNSCGQLNREHNSGGGPISTMGVTMCGYFMHAPESRPEREEDRIGAMPLELWRIALYARSLGCNYILFDRDADAVEALPIWDDEGHGPFTAKSIGEAEPIPWVPWVPASTDEDEGGLHDELEGA